MAALEAEGPGRRRHAAAVLLQGGGDDPPLEGGHPLHAATLDSFGDHRIAMAFAIAGLFAKGETIIRNTACINTSYPGFAHQLAAVIKGSNDPADYALPTVSR